MEKTDLGGGKKVGLFTKLINFAVENPGITLMGALVALGVLLPGDHDNYEEPRRKRKGKRKEKKRIPQVNPGKWGNSHHGISHITGKRY